MKRKSLWKVLEAGVLAFTLALSPVAALSAQAAPAEPKMGDMKRGMAPGDTVEIPVWGFAGALDGETVYSVDVEWGAMTFQYADPAGGGGVWDPMMHTYSGMSKGWYVYDGQTGSVADSDQTAINQISVTNHSNAAVKATFSYLPKGNPITGRFTADRDTQFDGGANSMKLDTADNGLGEMGNGKEVTGKVYFMPQGGGLTGSDGTTWEQLGTITVGIETGN